MNMEKYRNKFESEEHWKLKKDFLQAHKNKFSEERLLCLAQIFINIIVLKCRYSENIMKQMDELSIGIGSDYLEGERGRLKRTLIDASEVAKNKAKGIMKMETNTNETALKQEIISDKSNIINYIKDFSSINMLSKKTDTNNSIKNSTKDFHHLHNFVKAEASKFCNVSALKRDPVVPSLSLPHEIKSIEQINLPEPLKFKVGGKSYFSFPLNTGPSKTLKPHSLAMDVESFTACENTEMLKVESTPLLESFAELKIDSSAPCEPSVFVKIESCEHTVISKIESVAPVISSPESKVESVTTYKPQELKVESFGNCDVRDPCHDSSSSSTINSTENNTEYSFVHINQKLLSTSTLYSEPEELTTSEFQDILNNWNCYNLLTSAFSYSKLKLLVDSNQDKNKRKWACRLSVQIRKETWVLGTCVGCNYKTAKHLAARDAFGKIIEKIDPVAKNSKRYTYSTYADHPSFKDSANPLIIHSEIMMEMGDVSSPSFMFTVRNKMLTLIREVLKCPKQSSHLTRSPLTPQEIEDNAICLGSVKQEKNDSNLEEKRIKSESQASDTSSTCQLSFKTENEDSYESKNIKMEEVAWKETKSSISDHSSYVQNEERFNGRSSSRFRPPSNEDEASIIEYYQCLRFLKYSLKKHNLKVIENKTSMRLQFGYQNTCTLTVNVENEICILGFSEGSTPDRAACNAAILAVKMILEGNLLEKKMKLREDSKVSIAHSTAHSKEEELCNDGCLEDTKYKEYNINEEKDYSVICTLNEEERKNNLDELCDLLPLQPYIKRIEKNLLGMFKGLIHKYNKFVKASEPFDSFDVEEKLVKASDDEVLNQIEMLAANLQLRKYFRKRIFRKAGSQVSNTSPTSQLSYKTEVRDSYDGKEITMEKEPKKETKFAIEL